MLQIYRVLKIFFKKMFKFCLLLIIVTISLFPYLNNAECCHKKIVRYQMTDKNKKCSYFGGQTADFDMDDISNPRSDYCSNKAANKRICEISICDDGEPPKNGKTFCGQGSCNIFGCNCDGGCIKGNYYQNFLSKHQNEVQSI